jgi:hypothetical protein
LAGAGRGIIDNGTRERQTHDNGLDEALTISVPCAPVTTGYSGKPAAAASGTPSIEKMPGCMSSKHFGIETALPKRQFSVSA